MLDLIALVVALIISLFGIGTILALIVMCQLKPDREQYYEDLEQMEYLKKYIKEKELKKNNKKGIC